MVGGIYDWLPKRAPSKTKGLIMRTIHGLLFSLVLGITATVGTQAAQPPDVVASDGNANTAMGSYVLYDLTTAYYNTGAGYAALYLDQTGGYNTAFGAAALFENTASYNSAFGAFALELNSSGSGNTAVGYAALEQNAGGGDNTAVGYQALYSNSGGLFNVAIGQGALQNNVSGSSNTAIGETALVNATGGGNIAIGEKAGLSLTTGNNNIYIGIGGGSPTESGNLRIGGSAITTTYIAGISGSQVTGSAVYVTSSGQLGVLASSERFKTDVKPMGSASDKIAHLRPVTFKLKSDATGTTQYGLIAEEVAKVYPELVTRDAGGRINGVRYEELTPMLLNELQQQQARNAAQAEKIAALSAELHKFKQSVLQALSDARSRDVLLAHNAR